MATPRARGKCISANTGKPARYTLHLGQISF